MAKDRSIVILDGGRRLPRADILHNNKGPGLFTRFTATQLGELTTTQVRALTPALLNSLTATELQTLTTTQVAALTALPDSSTT